jgi:hypothetical protein
MNSNFKVLGMFTLVVLGIFGYEKYKGQQRENAFFEQAQANNLAQQSYREGFNKLNEVGNYTQGGTSASQDYDPNTIVNDPFGFSIPVLVDLKLLSMGSKNGYTFIDAHSGSRKDMIIVIPNTDDLNTIVQNLQSSGTPFTRIGNGISTSLNETGMAMNMVYNPSPNGGGLSIIRVITGTPAISQQTIDALFNGIRFREATASLEERKQLLEIDLQNQRNYNAQQSEQQQIENLRRQRAYEHWVHELNSVGDN